MIYCHQRDVMPGDGGLMSQPARWVELTMYLQSEISAKQKRDDEAEKAKMAAAEAMRGA